MRAGRSKYPCSILLCGILFVPTGCASPRAYHYAFWSDDPRPYLQAIQKSSASVGIAPTPGENIRAGIVTHHFLASGLMVRFFDRLQAKTSPETMILIGPNHFHHGRADISLSSLPWKTPFGMVETDRGVVHRIEATMGLPEDTEAFTGEHSVGVLIPLVKYYFPRCRVVPLLIDVNAEEPKLEALRSLLTGFLRNPKVLLLLSMDFSHNSDSRVADERDKLAEQVISKLDFDRVDSLHVDCHKGLRLLLSSLRDVGSVIAQFDEHTNSSRLTGNPKQTNVTSYFTVSFSTNPSGGRD